MEANMQKEFQNQMVELFGAERVDVPYASVWMAKDPDMEWHPSLTNSISDLADKIGADHIVYQDSMLSWDGWSRGDKGFYSLAENGTPTRDLDRALALALIQHIQPQFLLSQVERMLLMQDELNARTAGEDWIGKNLPWHRAIYMEAAEAIDSLPWKWWKSMPTDTENLSVEVVDIWHFVMSWMIAEGLLSSGGYLPEQLVAGAVQLILNDPDGVTAAQDVMSGRSGTAAYANFAIRHLERLIRLCSSDEAKEPGQYELVARAAMENLALMMALFPNKNMPALYYTKNWLNEHRQREGYNDPDTNYRKVNNISGVDKEDNAFALEWVSSNINAGKDVFFSAMREAGYFGEK